MKPLIPWEEARSLVVDGVEPLPPRAVPLDCAHGHALAADIRSPEAMPPFDNTSMDGFAVRSRDVAGAALDHPVLLSVMGFLPAGGVPPVQVLEAGQAVRIMTGAPIPAGADAVVPVEETDAWDPESERAGGAEARRVAVFREAKPGQNIRKAGESARVGEMIFSAGHRLRAQDVGLLISVGLTEVNVHSLPRVGVLSTGSELAKPGSPLKIGQIRDSNRPSLLLRLKEEGLPAVDLGIVPDDAADIETSIRNSFTNIDFLLTNGGVSVGDLDLTRSVLARMGEVRSYRVAVKPGMPQLFGRVGGVPVFGLPGNPVSALVVFDVFVLPALKKMAGRREIYRPLFDAVFLDTVRRKPGRTEFLRVRLEVEAGRWVARSTGPQGSGVLSSLTRANGYAVLPADLDRVEPGTTVRCQLLGHD